FVITRNTAFTFKGKAVDVKKLGRELNVRYVLEGSVQRGGNRLRVNVQLVDAETGNHLWAERFDKPVTDLFDLQDEVVSRIANTLAAQLVSAEARRAEGLLHPDAMDLYFQGRAWANRGMTPEHMMQARGFFERALNLPAETEGHVQEALRLSPRDIFALRWMMFLGYAKLFLNADEEAVMWLRRGLETNRNYPLAHFLLASALALLGNLDQAKAAARGGL